MMGKFLLQFCVLAICVFEPLVCYKFLMRLLTPSVKVAFTRGLIAGVGIGFVTHILFFGRNVLFFANNVWIEAIFYTCVWSLIIFRKYIFEVIELIIIYYGLAALLDFFFGFVIANYLQGKFWNTVYFMTMSWWSVLIYTATRLCLLVLLLLIKKYMVVKIPMKQCRLILLIMAVGICVLVKYYRWVLLELIEEPPYKTDMTVVFSVMVILLFIGITMLFVLKSKAIQQEKEILLMKAETQETLFQELNLVTEQKRGLWHDMQNHVLVLKKLANEGKLDSVKCYLEQIADEIPSGYTKWTGCQVLDILLGQKLERAKASGIEMEIESNGVVKSVLRETELVSLFGNLLDNAIEACQKVTEKRWIGVEIERRHMITHIRISNTVEHKPLMRDGALVSMKSDKGRHGYGTKNIQRVVEKYDGTIKYEYEKPIFRVYITLYEKNEE